MKKISAIARVTLRVLFRNGGGWALLGLTILLMSFVYAVSRSDGQLLNELQLRSRYALYFGNTVFSLALLWLACYSMRGDIDAKRMHLLTSYPLQRVRIYLGKWLGLLIFAGVGIGCMLATISVANIILIQRSDSAADRAELGGSFWVVEREVRARADDVEEKVTETLAQMRAKGDLDDMEGGAAALADLRRELTHQLRMEQQMIPEGNARRWFFHMGSVSQRRDTVRLQYRFYAQRDDEELGGTFMIHSTVLPSPQPIPVTFYSRQTQSVTFPTNWVPADGVVSVQFTPKRGTPSLLAYHGTGVRLFYQDRGYWSNMANYTAMMLAHFAALIAVGLTVSTLFTLSIATFASTVLYVLALTGDFFQRFLREEIGVSGGGAFEPLIRGFITFGLFFTTGLEQPALIENLTNSVSIGMYNLQMDMTHAAGELLLTPVRLASDGLYLRLQESGATVALGFAVYLLGIMAVGSWLLTRKELDRVH